MPSVISSRIPAPAQSRCRRVSATSSRRKVSGMSSRLARVRRCYDADPAAYHRGMSSLLTERLLAARRRKVGEMVRGRLLDVGFGTGLSAQYYSSEVRVVGIDASLPMLQFARRKGGVQDRVELLVMDAERLAFPDRCFDSVAFN